MIVSIIFAMNAARIIGNKGELPWSLPSDLRRFKQLTTGHPVIMGRKTFDSILARNGKPLPGRTNVVITRNTSYWKQEQRNNSGKFQDCMFVSSLDEGILLTDIESEIFIIGGAEIYAQALPIADRMYFTQVSGAFEGDAKFPLFNMNDWGTIHDKLVCTDEHPYAYSILSRTNRAPSSRRIAASNLVNPAFAKNIDYGNTIDEILKAGDCPFCPNNFRWHPWPILQRSGEWFITRSGWPYKNAGHHFLILGNHHLISTVEMTPEDSASVRHLTSWAVAQFNLKGYGRMSRSGDTNYTGATVQHLHFHLIQPKLDLDGKTLTVNFPIG